MRKEVLNICFNLYLVIALRKYANPSSVLLQSIYNLLRSREGMQTEGKTEYMMWKTATLYCLRKIRIGCRLQVFFKTDVLKNFALFAGKQLHWSLCLIKLHAWKAAIVLERLEHMYFLVNIVNSFLTEHFGGCFWKKNSK